MKERINVSHEEAALFIEKSIMKQVRKSIHKKFTSIVVVCVGSDRATGDSLGPLVVTFLFENKCFRDYIRVHGILGNTVNALNVSTVSNTIDKDNSLVIAIDASFGDVGSSIGDIIIADKGLYPGLAVNKHFPLIGDISILGIVYTNSDMNSLIVNTLPLVDTYNMARVIEKGLRKAMYKIARSNNLRYISEQLASEAAVTKW